MKAISYSDARQNLKWLLDDICTAHEPVIIARKRGGNAVVMSQEDYDSLVETEYLLREPANARHLAKSLKEALSGKKATLKPPRGKAPAR